MSKVLVEVTAVVALISAGVLADSVWSPPLNPPASAAPQIPPGPQPFAPDPRLGVPTLPGPVIVPPPPGGFTVMDMTTGQMRICQKFGAMIVCH